MKIAILTQPLGKNYGGILQAYALQVIVKDLEHTVWTVDRQYPKRKSLYIKKRLSIIKRIIKYILLSKPNVIRIWPTKKEINTIYRNNKQFVNDYIQLTESIYSTAEFSLLEKYNFDAYIVGSDQTWRPKYSPCISNFFLDFLKEKDTAKRIAFATSFGVDYLEYSEKELAVCSPLAKKFDAISVREDSAIKLCQTHFGVNAIHVVDPTLLLEKEDYICLVEKDNIVKSKGTLMTYVLDSSTDKREVIEKVANELNLIEFSVLPKNKFSEVGRKQIDDCIYPSITTWIRGFMDAEYVITDSFHGTAFAIIFNKPFIAIGNAKRGLSRFKSLLNLFSLEERLILSKSDLTKELISKPVDFKNVNKIRAEKKIEAINFLKNALEN